MLTLYFLFLPINKHEMPFIGLLSILGEGKSLGKLTLAPIIHLLEAPCSEGILNKIVKAINKIFS